MTYGSLVPDVKAALVTVLTARAGLSGVTVDRSTPVDGRDFVTSTGVGEAIWIGRLDGQDTEIEGETGPAIGGRLDPNEAFTVWLTISVLKDTSSGGEDVAQERAYTLLGEVLGTVFADPTLGIAAPNLSRSFKGVLSHSAREINERLRSTGYWTRIEVGLNCMGRLTLT